MKTPAARPTTTTKTETKTETETETEPEPGLLTRADVRALVEHLEFRPTKRRGQNFLVDPNTVRRLVRLAGVTGSDTVLEIGPGLGSLTLGLLGQARRVVAVELDPALANLLPHTATARLGEAVAGQLAVLCADALRLTADDLAAALAALPADDDRQGREASLDRLPGVLAANLPYNVAVPLLLELLAAVPSLRRGLVMVQAEVADRLTASPGNRVYGAPTVKLAWYARARAAGRVPRPVFWPEPNVDSGLVAFERHEPATAPPRPDELRREVFAAVDAAFAQRRKTLRSALAGWAGSPSRLETFAAEAGVSPGARGETLDVDAFVRLAQARARHTDTDTSTSTS